MKHPSIDRVPTLSEVLAVTLQQFLGMVPSHDDVNRICDVVLSCKKVKLRL